MLHAFLILGIYINKKSVLTHEIVCIKYKSVNQRDRDLSTPFRNVLLPVKLQKN